MQDWKGNGGRKEEEENSKPANDAAVWALLPASSPPSHCHFVFVSGSRPPQPPSPSVSLFFICPTPSLTLRLLGLSWRFNLQLSRLSPELRYHQVRLCRKTLQLRPLPLLLLTRVAVHVRCLPVIACGMVVMTSLWSCDLTPVFRSCISSITFSACGGGTLPRQRTVTAAGVRGHHANKSMR